MREEDDSIKCVGHDNYGAVGVGKFHIGANLVEVCLVDVRTPNNRAWKVCKVAFLETLGFGSVGKKQHHLLSPLLKGILVGRNVAEEMVGGFAVGRNQGEDVITATCGRENGALRLRLKVVEEIFRVETANHLEPLFIMALYEFGAHLSVFRNAHEIQMRKHTAVCHTRSARHKIVTGVERQAFFQQRSPSLVIVIVLQNEASVFNLREGEMRLILRVVQVARRFVSRLKYALRSRNCLCFRVGSV